MNFIGLKNSISSAYLKLYQKEEESYYFTYCTTESGKVFFQIDFFFFAICGNSRPFFNTFRVVSIL